MAKVETPPSLDYTPTLPNLIHRAADEHGAREFLVLGNQRLSFRDTERESAKLARGLIALGIGKATRVGIIMPNTPDWALAFFASARVGALSVLLSTLYQARELDWALRHNDVDTLLVSARYLNIDYVERLERALPGLAESKDTTLYLPSHPYLRRIIVFGDCDRPWAIKGPQDLHAAAQSNPRISDDLLKAIEAQIAPSDFLVTICTSGSTAEPKSVLHSHGTAARSAHAFLPYLSVGKDDRIYCGMPFFWVGGVSLNLLTSMVCGACMVCAPTPNPRDILDVLEREKVTRISAWPAQVAGIREVAEREKPDFKFPRNGLVPADSVPADRRMGGILGMTETFSMHSLDYVDNPTPPGSAGHWGRAFPGIERKIVDPLTGETLPPGREGELYLRGYTVMQGYYKKEREQSFTKDGFFATGDLCSIDEDGYLFFKGRGGEMIKTGGANVAPREVEMLMQTYPGVREALVFGLPDPLKGEIVVAVAVPALGQRIDPEALRARLREDISAYKVPQTILVMDYDEIPRTDTAKAKKPQLRDMIVQRLKTEKGRAS